MKNLIPRWPWLALLVATLAVGGHALAARQAAPPPMPRADAPPVVVPPAPPKPAPDPVAPKGPAKPNVVAGLSLDEPQKKTRPGLAYVTATVAAKDGAKVKIVWDVEAQWADEDAEWEWEVRDGGRKVQITIPDSSGIVRISAVAVVDGEPTSDSIAKTVVVVEYTPRAKPAPQPAPQPAPAPPQPKADAPAPKAEAPAASGKPTDIYFVIDTDGGDPNINALVTSQALRNALRKVGLAPHVFDKDSANVGRAGMQKYVEDAGGVPVMVLVTADRKVKRSSRVPATLGEVVAFVSRP